MKANEVTVSAGGKTYEMNIAGAKVGETNLKFSDHTLTETTAKMAIQRLVVSPADAASALPYLAAAGGYQAALASAAYTHWAASAAPYAGFRDGPDPGAPWRRPDHRYAAIWLGSYPISTMAGVEMTAMGAWIDLR